MNMTDLMIASYLTLSDKTATRSPMSTTAVGNMMSQAKLLINAPLKAPFSKLKKKRSSVKSIR